jgi:hypothetical protein
MNVWHSIDEVYPVAYRIPEYTASYESSLILNLKQLPFS